MKKLFALLAFGMAIGYHATAQVKLPAFFSDSMVLQQNTNAPVWGWASPGQKVTVSGSWSKKTLQGIADQQGKWMIKLPTPKAGGPYDVIITAGETRTLHGVLIGEVWICSGQSNMEMPVQGWPNTPIVNSANEIAQSSYPAIRMFTVEKTIAYAPQQDVKGSWVSASPASTGSFSATAYFFGRELYKQLHVPIGLIHTSWGGTIAEAWTSAPALQEMGDFNKNLKQIDSVRQNLKAMKLKDSLNEVAWQQAQTKQDPGYAETNKQWATMQQPGFWEQAGLPDLDGIVWFKRTVEIPAAWAGKDLKLDLGPIDDKDITYFNGHAIDSTTKGFTWIAERHYTIPGTLVKAGSNILSVKITDDGGNGGMYGKPSQMILYPAGGTAAEGIPLSGAWQYSIAATKPQAAISSNPNQPSVLYNAMIAPLVPYAIKGAIWYQGESNVGRAKQYTTLFPLMIRDWRTRWQEGNFPFYFVQIAPFNYMGDSTLAASLCDAQRRTLNLSPNTGMAVTLDIGDRTNIHPANKQGVGKRLALWALNKNYQQTNTTYTGPLYKSLEVKGNTVIVSFTNTDGGLTSPAGTLKDFELQDASGEWKPATAKITGDKITVSSDAVKAPKGVRYAFYAWAQASLFNGKGLPASSFTSAPLQ